MCIILGDAVTKTSKGEKAIGSDNEKLRVNGWQFYVHKKLVSNSVMFANIW